MVRAQENYLGLPLQALRQLVYKGDNEQQTLA